jgi:nucleoside-diphosphate-sugar epimerase
MDTELVQPHTGYKEVLVTGGVGFIGSNVAEYLLSRGDDVVIIDEMNDYFWCFHQGNQLEIAARKLPWWQAQDI